MARNLLAPASGCQVLICQSRSAIVIEVTCRALGGSVRCDPCARVLPFARFAPSGSRRASLIGGGAGPLPVQSEVCMRSLSLLIALSLVPIPARSADEPAR